MNQDQIRNFCIIAHVDHGKSTLADRMLELTHTVSDKEMQEQFLDQNPISRERGITIKLAPVRMNYTLDANSYTLNLIDTPGHVDFSYEVSRTLAACEGAILLVDATQGIQAQTVAHFREAKKLNLAMIPVINKIDLPNAQVAQTEKELFDFFGFTKDQIMYVSAKTGKNVDELLKKIVEIIPSPVGVSDSVLKSLIFDAVYDEYRGVVAYVRVFDGEVKAGDRVRLYQSGMDTEVTEVGYFIPNLSKSERLKTGEIGYVITGVKDIRYTRVGDTITSSNFQFSIFNFQPLAGYKIPKPMVFFGVYPQDQKYIRHLKDSLQKLTLNDTSLSYTSEHSSYLGSGFRVGFLGLLHADIVKQRLKQEFNLDLLFTIPQVLYEKNEDGSIEEPYVKLSVYVPTQFVGNVMGIIQNQKGVLLDMEYKENLAVLEYEIPYSIFVRGLPSDLKSVSSGFASIDYEVTGFKSANLVNLEVRINDQAIDVLSEYVYKDEAAKKAREKAEQLKESLPRQQFRQIIQGVIDGNILAREEIPPFRKDVLQKMSGGDRTRKDKLLEAQKKGKSKMLSSSKVELSQKALYSLLEHS